MTCQRLHVYLSLALLYLCVHLVPKRESPVSQRVKSLPAMQETQDQPLGQEDPLEEGMEIHSSILAWRIPWTEKPGGLQSMGSHRVRHN